MGGAGVKGDEAGVKGERSHIQHKFDSYISRSDQNFQVQAVAFSCCCLGVGVGGWILLLDFFCFPFLGRRRANGSKRERGKYYIHAHTSARAHTRTLNMLVYQ